MSAPAPDTSTGFRTARIEALCDGIFAIVMTLLVLELHVPDIAANLVSTELGHRLFDLLPKFLSFGVSFVIAGVYWVGHHNQFFFIKRADRVLLWINILFLLCMAFLPFSTALLGTYPFQPIAIIFYGANLIVIGLVLDLHWRYGTRGPLMDAPLPSRVINTVHSRILMGPGIYLIAILLAYFIPILSLIIYVIVPILYILPGHIDLHFRAPRSQE